MDLNQLYFQHQISSMRAACAKDGPMRTNFQSAADGFASQIERFQLGVGAGAAATWRSSTSA